MRQAILIGAMILVALPMHGQDLLLNGGFERFKKCPKAPWNDPIHQLQHVKGIQGDPGFFHACSELMGTPANWAGRQTPAEGEGYAGLVLTAHGGGECASREFIQLKLREPLLNGRKYRLSFLVSLADMSGYYTDGIGACFSTTDRSRKGVAGLIGKPDIENPLEFYLNDTAGWIKVEGVYNATGGERFLLLGNFQACNRTTRKAVTPNTGAGVLHNMMRKARAGMMADERLARSNKLLATRSYVYLDAVELEELEGFERSKQLTQEIACASDTGTPSADDELVPDPGFDNNVPSSRAHWKNASGGTPDLLQGVTGIYLYSAVNRDHREFIFTGLKKPLDPCGTYRIRMRIRRDPSYGYAVDGIGIALVDSFSKVLDRDILPLPIAWSSPQGHIMDDTEQWTVLCGEFPSPGCARDLVIGNFRSDENTILYRINDIGGPFAYYFLDDVSLWKVGTRQDCFLECDPPQVDGAAPSLDDPPSFLDRLPRVIHFEIADHVPDGELDELASDLIRYLEAHPKVQFVVIGHTDDSGTPQANMELSRKRAEAVFRKLVQMNVPPSGILVEYRGSTDPIADNATVNGRRLNRRAEVVIQNSGQE